MKHIVVLLLLALTATSCKKFIDEQSQDQLVPKTAKDFIELLNGEGYPKTGAQDALQMGLGLMDDDVQLVNLPISFNNTPSNLSQQMGYLSFFTWQPDAYEQATATGLAGNKDLYNAWSNYYNLILGTNIALDYADQCAGADADKAYLKGQAYGLRAFYYFMLVNLYGMPYNAPGTTPDKSLGVPLVLTSIYNPAAEHATRNTVKEVYDRITTDLDSAVYFLEKDKSVVSVYRLNYLSAHFLAARVYLYMEQWDQVIKHTNIVLAEQPALMALQSWPAAVSQTLNPIVGTGNIESIWAYGSYADHSYLLNGSPTVCVSDSLIDSFEPGDLRRNIFMVPLAASDASRFGYRYANGKKYVPKSPAAEKAFRVAEAYLNRAEAYIQLYKKGDAGAGQRAVNDLNTLRSKRFTSDTYTDWTLVPADSLLVACRKERRRELFQEDSRWFDLRRYGMPAITHVFYGGAAADRVQYTLTARDAQYVWPIPIEVLDRNNNLQQNVLAPQRSGVSF